MPPSLVVRVAGNLDALKKDLKEGEKVIQATSAQMEKLAKSFSGERLITHAKNVTAAIREVGVTTLTASQASRQLDLLERAMDKMRKTSETIPANMKATAEQLRFVSRSAEAAVPPGQQVAAVYRQFDGVLQSMGVNIGPYVKGIEDVTSAVAGMGTATGGATSALSLLGPAAAVVATAIGAWKLGTHIGQVTGWTDAIAKGTAVLRGYGDVAQETALAIADAADLSGKYEINLRRQIASTEAHTKAAKEQSDEIKRNWSITEGNTDAFRQLNQQLEAAKKKRHDDAVATFAASQAQSIFKDETKATTTVISEQTKALDAREESLKRIAGAEAARKEASDKFMQAQTLNHREAATVSGDVPVLSGFALDNVVNRFRQAGETNPEVALRRALSELEAKEGRVKTTDNTSFFNNQADQVLLAQLRMMFGGGRLPGFATGVENFSGGMAMVGERGPELVNLPRGSNVVPNHQLGQTITIAPQIVFRGGVIGSPIEFQAMVEASILNVLRSRGISMPAGRA